MSWHVGTCFADRYTGTWYSYWQHSLVHQSGNTVTASNKDFPLGGGAPRGLFLMMNVESNLGLWFDSQPLLDHLANSEEAVWLGGIAQPNRQLVPLPAHIHNGAIYLMCVLVCMFSNEKEEYL